MRRYVTKRVPSGLPDSSREDVASPSRSRSPRRSHVYEDEEIFLPDLKVHETEDPYEYSGLLNHRGEKLYHDHSHYPVGFHAKHDEDS